MDKNLKIAEEKLIIDYKKSLEENELLNKFSGLTTTEIADSISENYVMDYKIKPISSGMKLLGRALTVQLPHNESKFTINAIEKASPLDILVVNTNNTTDKAVFGDVKITMAMKNKIGGAVVDGAIRDAEKITQLGFPLFARHNVICAGGKKGEGELNVNILCGGVSVNSGDIIMGDDNGVVVIPQDMVEEVLNKAYAKLKSDEEKLKKILLG